MTIGVLELTSKYRYGLTTRGTPIYLFVPYDADLPACIVGCSHRDLSRNQIAEIMVDDWTPEKPRGNLVRLIGPVGNYEAEKEAILVHYSGSRGKLKDLECNTDDTDERIEISAETGWRVLHVDPPGCKDIDDAMAWNPTLKTWCITIADVAAAVAPDSEIDRRACSIGASFYVLNGRVMLPMLPAQISEDSASLLPGKRRKGITLLSGKFVMSWITVAESYTYDTFVGTEEDPHMWIEKAMIQYNSEAARVLKEAGCGILRTQTAGPKWSITDPALAFLAMEAAEYEHVDPAKEQTHASLGLYCHASSPLRRYADLVNQRCLKQILRSSSSASIEVAEHLNARMKANRRFTRDLTFLEYVTPGRVHTIDVTWLSDSEVWVPAWKRILRLRHSQLERTPQITIFCDPMKRNWKQRVLTAPP